MKRHNWKKVAAVVLLSLVVLLAACQSGGETDPIRLGVIAPLSGGGTSYGVGIEQGAEMAVEEINEAGGVDGREIELVVVDDASDPAESVTAMNRLVNQENVDVIVGGWGSSQILAHQATVEEAGVPYIIVGGTNPNITSEDNEWSFRVIQTDGVQGIELANLAVNKLGYDRIAVIYDSNDYGTGNRDVFVGRLEELGVEPVAVETYQTNDKDFAAQLTKIRETDPQALAVFGTIPAAPAIMEQARNLGIEAQFLGTGGLANEQLIGLGGDAVEGTILTTYFHSDADARSTQWADEYVAKFASDTTPPRPVLAAWEYRAIKDILYPILQEAGSDKEAIREGLESYTGQVFGIEGDVHFDETGQLVQNSVLVTVKDGNFELFTP